MDLFGIATKSIRILLWISVVGGLNQVYRPNRPTPSVKSMCGKYINIFTRCTNRNQDDILMTTTLLPPDAIPWASPPLMNIPQTGVPPPQPWCCTLGVAPMVNTPRLDLLVSLPGVDPGFSWERGVQHISATGKNGTAALSTWMVNTPILVSLPLPDAVPWVAPTMVNTPILVSLPLPDAVPWVAPTMVNTPILVSLPLPDTVPWVAPTMVNTPILVLLPLPDAVLCPILVSLPLPDAVPWVAPTKVNTPILVSHPYLMMYLGWCPQWWTPPYWYPFPYLMMYLEWRPQWWTPPYWCPSPYLMMYLGRLPQCIIPPYWCPPPLLLMLYLGHHLRWWTPPYWCGPVQSCPSWSAGSVFSFSLHGSAPSSHQMYHPPQLLKWEQWTVPPRVDLHVFQSAKACPIAYYPGLPCFTFTLLVSYSICNANL